MARTKTHIDRRLVEDAIGEVEKNGPLKNLGSLWRAVAVIYNKLKKKEARSVTANAIMNRAKELGLDHVTKAGKKGESGGKRQEILMGITEWETKASTRGRNIGNVTDSRFVIACDSMNWVIGKEVKGVDGLQRGRYMASFKMLLPATEEHKVINIAQRVADALYARLGGDRLRVQDGTLCEQGLAIDNFYQTSHHRHESVLERLFPYDSGQEMAIHDPLVA
jgi:tRNA(Leu) C34 or U34 (ribose-2'-O)-methylase TrmL